MKVCVYDNPDTMRRECWQDGYIIYSCLCQLLGKIPAKQFPFYATIGPWKTGQIAGDSAAIALSAVPR